MIRSQLLSDLDRTAQWLHGHDLAGAEHVVSSFPTPHITIDDRRVISFSTNNYLGLNHDPAVKAAALDALSTHTYCTSESRRLGGNLDLLEELEAALASYKQMPASMVTVTGLLANIAAIHGVIDTSMLASRWYGAPERTNAPVILYDELAHHSIRMGARLAKTERHKFRHNDAGHLADLLADFTGRAALVVTEGVFSMDGDLADLPAVLEACEHAEAALLVDDAHGTGVYGCNGAGTVDHFGLTGRVHLQVATLSKALGGLGGAVLADKSTISMLKSFAAGYRFTSSLPAEVAAGLITSLKVMGDRQELRDRLWANTSRLRTGLTALGFHPAGNGPIIPLLVGSSAEATHIEHELLARGYWCAAVLPPLVAPDQCRIRLTATAMHTPEHIDGLLCAIGDL
jgi:7-keto-8-aminopelargonate synthetase-like enzyme